MEGRREELHSSQKTSTLSKRKLPKNLDDDRHPSRNASVISSDRNIGFHTWEERPENGAVSESPLSYFTPSQSIGSYHCLFSLPPFVCFVKVLLSIIMNHIFSSCSYLFSWLEVERGG